MEMLGYNWIKAVRTKFPSILAGSGLRRDRNNNVVVISYKNAANTTYTTYKLDQVNLMENINEFIVEPCTN